MVEKIGHIFFKKSHFFRSKFQNFVKKIDIFQYFWTKIPLPTPIQFSSITKPKMIFISKFLQESLYEHLGTPKTKREVHKCSHGHIGRCEPFYPTAYNISFPCFFGSCQIFLDKLTLIDSSSYDHAESQKPSKTTCSIYAAVHTFQLYAH